MSIKNIPDTIYLQVGDAEDCDYNELVGVTFHHKRVDKNDIEYIHCDIVKEMIKQIYRDHKIELK